MGYNMQSDRCLGNASSQQHCAPGVVREDKNESDSSGFLILAVCNLSNFFIPPRISSIP
jgi:hypothetical protein